MTTLDCFALYLNRDKTRLLVVNFVNHFFFAVLNLCKKPFRWVHTTTTIPRKQRRMSNMKLFITKIHHSVLPKRSRWVNRVWWIWCPYETSNLGKRRLSWKLPKEVIVDKYLILDVSTLTSNPTYFEFIINDRAQFCDFYLGLTSVNVH